MFAVERKSRIIQLLESQGQAEVSELSSILGVVPETIRRDLKELEKQGIITRTHGGAIFGIQSEHEYPILVRKMQNKDEKDRLCEYVAEYIDDKDTVFIDNSSTTANILNYIPNSKRVTVITNSIYLLLQYSKMSSNNITMISTGGIFNRSNQSLTGSLSLKIANEFLPNKAIMSCRGLSAENAFTDNGLYETDIKRLMIEKAKEVYFIMDHSKIDKSGSVVLGGFDICKTLFTDRSLSEELTEQIMRDNPDMEIILCDGKSHKNSEVEE